jgi:hypothetical protein
VGGECRWPLLEQGVHNIARAGVVCGFEMFPKALAANRDAFLDDGGCFSTGEGIAFGRIAGLGEFHAKPFFEIADKGRGRGR